VGSRTITNRSPERASRLQTVRHLIIFLLPFQGVGLAGGTYPYPVGVGYNPDAPFGANIKNKNSTDILPFFKKVQIG
ncbi:MAG: hypothetical protein LBF88_07780, partial [Planctomycetaceae bacterium]|nr:hypothetical protein [Planctomycetaceae bacterium]